MNSSLEISPQQYAARTFVPKRLIDVRGATHLRLVDRVDTQNCKINSTSYAALSYCWGPRGANFTTTDENVSDHKQGFDFESLPEAHKDAVKVTRALGIPYLWIDAICIVQGNASDWQEQCSQMGDIYGMATVTLIAGSSSTCRASFLKRERVQKIMYRTPSESGGERSYLITYHGHYQHPGEDVVPPRFPWLPISGSEDSTYITPFWRDLTESAWARRGWTFQENFLSSRKIVFGNAEVHFVNHGQAISRIGGVAVDVLVPFDQLTTVPRIRCAWIEVLKQYSRFTPASFTVPSDLLPALSGLASRFGDLLSEDVYVAGHWSGDLHVSLMWKTYHHIDFAPDSDQADSGEQRLANVEIVPSWSSLSRGHLIFIVEPENDGIIKSEVKSMELIPNVGTANKGRDPCSLITLEGHVLDLTRFSWSPDHADFGVFRGSAPDGAGTVITIDETEIRTPDSRLPAKITNADDDAWLFFLHLDDLLLLGDNHRAWDNSEQLVGYRKHFSCAFLLLLGSKSSGRYPGGYGLVIVSTNSPDQENSFRRAGCFITQRPRDRTPKSESVEFLRGIMEMKKVTLI